MMQSAVADLVTLVNEQGQAIGEMDKLAAHRGAGVLHLACSVYLFRQNSKTHQVEVLIQQRSALKIVGAQQWANTVCGNVRPGETPLECADRRMREELGFTHQQLQAVTAFLYATPCNSEFSEREFDHILAGWYIPEENSLNPAEVVATEWVGWEQVVAEIKSDPALCRHDFAPWFRLMITDAKVKRALENFISSVT